MSEDVRESVCTKFQPCSRSNLLKIAVGEGEISVL